MNLWPMTFFLAAVALVPPGVILWIFSESGWVDGTFGTVVLIMLGLWVAYWGVRAALNGYRYRNDLWTITNQRIVDSFRSTPLNLRIATADLVNIQDMSVHRRGILQTMLNYGDVVCDTAGGAKEQQFVLSGDPKPAKCPVARRQGTRPRAHAPQLVGYPQISRISQIRVASYQWRRTRQIRFNRTPTDQTRPPGNPRDCGNKQR